MLPNAIDHHPRRQGVIRLHQPFRQRQSPSARPIERLQAVGFKADAEHRRHTGVNRRPGIAVFAAIKNVDRGGISSHVEQRAHLRLGAKTHLRLDERFKQCEGRRGRNLGLFPDVGPLLDRRGKVLDQRLAQDLADLDPNGLGHGGFLFFEKFLAQRSGQRPQLARQARDFRLNGYVVPRGFFHFFRRGARQQAAVRLVPIGVRSDVGFVRGEPIIGVVRASQDGAQPVIVALRDGVVFVVVAAGATDGQTHHR